MNSWVIVLLSALAASGCHRYETVTLTVMDTEGRPIADAVCHAEGRGPIYQMHWVSTGTTDDVGVWHTEWALNTRVGIAINAPGYEWGLAGFEPEDKPIDEPGQIDAQYRHGPIVEVGKLDGRNNYYAKLEFQGEHRRAPTVVITIPDAFVGFLLIEYERQEWTEPPEGPWVYEVAAEPNGRIVSPSWVRHPWGPTPVYRYVQPGAVEQGRISRYGWKIDGTFKRVASIGGGYDRELEQRIPFDRALLYMDNRKKSGYDARRHAGELLYTKTPKGFRLDRDAFDTVASLIESSDGPVTVETARAALERSRANAD